METFYPELSPRFAGFLAQLPGRKVAVVGHARPDGDCIGSQAALARVLRARGHEVVCLNPDPVPRRLQFLVDGVTFLRPAGFCRGRVHGGVRRLRRPGPRGPEVEGAFSRRRSATSTTTCPAPASPGTISSIPPPPPPRRSWRACCSTTDCRSTPRRRRDCTSEFSPIRASSASTPRRAACFLLAAELRTRGADPAAAGFELYERETVGTLQLLQRFLASLRFECGGRICVGLLPERRVCRHGDDARGYRGHGGLRPRH